MASVSKEPVLVTCRMPGAPRSFAVLEQGCKLAGRSCWCGGWGNRLTLSLALPILYQFGKRVYT
jgi:hypothetical protein